MRFAVAISLFVATATPCAAGHNESSLVQTVCGTLTSAGAFGPVTWKTPFKSSSYTCVSSIRNAAASPQQSLCSCNTSSTATTVSGTCNVTQAVAALGSSATVATGAVAYCVTGVGVTQ